MLTILFPDYDSFGQFIDEFKGTLTNIEIVAPEEDYDPNDPYSYLEHVTISGVEIIMCCNDQPMIIVEKQVVDFLINQISGCEVHEIVSFDDIITFCQCRS